MRKMKRWSTVLAGMAAVLLVGGQAQAANTAGENMELDSGKLYMIWDAYDAEGNELDQYEKVMFDNGGESAGWLKYDANYKSEYSRKYNWRFTPVEGQDGRYYMRNQKTFQAVKGTAMTTEEDHPGDYVVTDKTVANQGGGYILEVKKVEDDKCYVAIKSAETGKYMTTEEGTGDRTYVKFSDSTDGNNPNSDWWCIAEDTNLMEGQDGKQMLWMTLAREAHYRIPAITTANNGDLLAITDLRYGSHWDIGTNWSGHPHGHQIDLLLKISEDNGANWGDSINLTSKYSRPPVSASELAIGFGDTALVADRETDKVLLLCVSGSYGYADGGTPSASSMLSTDGGKNFGAPREIHTQIYNQINGLTDFFFASGRIMQSRYIKEGSSYRIYSAILGKGNGISGNCNYVFYSDDFGTNWKLLGNGPAITGADEAKIEELPNGNVIITSRRGAGRTVNVFTYNETDDTYATGTWDTQQVVSYGAGNSTNGELYITYVKNKETEEYGYLALQSLPTINNGSRVGVSIFYKELGEADVNSAGYVANWNIGENRYLVQEHVSAYSTMTLQADGKIGFLWEERDNQYDILYDGIAIEEITNDKYEFAFTSGIGSVATPYVVSTHEQLVAVVDVFNKEGVYWDFSGEAENGFQGLLEERKQQAQTLYDEGGLAGTRAEAVALKSSLDAANALEADAEQAAILEVCKNLGDAIWVYEGLAQLEEELAAKLQQAKGLKESNKLIAARYETKELQTAIEAAEDKEADVTYQELQVLVNTLAEKIAAYENAQTANFSVEARYSSNHIRISSLEGVTAYSILRSTTGEDGEYTPVNSISAAEGKKVYSYIDEDAPAGTQYWYKVTTTGGIDIPESAPLQDSYPTGVEAVQKHAEEGQLHYDFVAGEEGEYTYFNGNRMIEGTEEDLAKVKDLTAGSVIISYKPDEATGRKSLLILKQKGVNMPTGVSSNLGETTGFAFFQEAAQFRWDSSKNGLRGSFGNGSTAADIWSTFGLSNGVHGIATSNVVNSWNGNNQTGWNDSRWNGFMTRPANLGVLTIGADKTSNGIALAYNGHIAYVTITDEVMSQTEMNNYTRAVTELLEAEEAKNLPAPEGFTATVEGGQVTLNWTAVPGIVDKYQVSSDNGTNWVDADSSTDHVFADLAGGRDYTFKVRAVNGGGEGAEAEATATLSELIVATPTFSVEEGTYTEAQTVEISTATAEATIYYTLDGTEPTETSTEYTEAIPVNATTTIKAIAVKEGMENSEVASVTYTISTEEEPEEKQTVETPAFSVPAGTYKEVQKVAITSATQGATIYYTTNGTAPTTDSTEYTQEITVSESMTIKAIAVKEGMENSAVAEAAYVIEKAPAEKETVKTPAFSVAAGTYDKAQSVTLTSETEGATIYYTTDGKEPTTSSTKYSQAIMVDKSMTIKAIAVKEGMNNSTVAQAAYVIQLPDSPDSVRETVKTPAFSVKAGTYNKAQSVTLSCATAGATIYYTTDGKTPTISSAKYSKAITVDKTMTIKAIAVKSGMNNSAVASAAYTIKVEVKDKPWIFTDVEQNSNWKHQSVKYVYNKDIMGAVGASTEFQPDRPLSRSMFATVLYRMADSPKVAYKAQFSDVPAGKWYSDAIIWAYQNKIVSGLGDGSFGINQNITREQIAKMLYEYANVCKYDVSAKKDLNSFTDVKAVSGWAVEYMQWATAVEMITGKPNDEAKTSFRMDPKGEATRAECAAMLMR
ncbi:MAG: chitobiase/beta-hexosaminidase C-terminal domain-containing protein, partial [Lachnospiraceae bacterium]|nr:chitobiase/beta-hexosaminidase C-terminal domain-containing protein [Lachnospiraceae bacterium]